MTILKKVIMFLKLYCTFKLKVVEYYPSTNTIKLNTNNSGIKAHDIIIITTDILYIRADVTGCYDNLVTLETYIPGDAKQYINCNVKIVHSKTASSITPYKNIKKAKKLVKVPKKKQKLSRLERHIADVVVKIVNYTPNINLSIDNSKPTMLTLRFLKYSTIELHSILISPSAIIKIIKSNFTIFERIYYSDKHLADAAIAYIMLFIDNLLSFGNAAELYKTFYHLRNTRYKQEVDILAQESISEFIDSVCTSIISTVWPTRDLFDFTRCNVMTKKRITKILKVYSKVLRNDLRNAILLPCIDKDIIADLK